MSRIELVGVSIERGGIPLITNLSLKVQSGEAMRLVGPNGRGKTTLLRSISGLIDVTAGGIRYEGIRPEEVLYLDHKLLMKSRLTVEENIHFWVEIFNADQTQVEQACQQLGLRPLLHLPYEVLSSGQKKRVQLSLLFLKRATLWLLDEPLLSLDAHYSRMLSTICQSHLGAGGILIYASHDALHGLAEQILDVSHRGYYDLSDAA